MPTLPPLPLLVPVVAAATKARALPARLIETFEWDSGGGKFDMQVTHATVDTLPWVTHRCSGWGVVQIQPGETAREALARLVRKHGLTRVASQLRLDRTQSDER